jgi:hypothetical protein
MALVLATVVALVALGLWFLLSLRRWRRRAVRPFEDADLLAYSAEHVSYEFDMFLWSARVCSSVARISGPSPEDEARLNCALIENFVVHLRNVIEFLYRRKPRSTDVVAVDFCDSGAWRPTITRVLKAARKRADKELAHLTTARIAGAPPGKEWDFIGLEAELRPVMRCFVKKALPSRLSLKVTEVIG